METPSGRGFLRRNFRSEIQHSQSWGTLESGAGNPAMENTRLGNAKTVRDRLDQILQENPKADVIIGGDFNTQYNQGQRYSFMTKTAIPGCFRFSRGRSHVQGEGKPDLYNLWFDLPPDQRFSDEYNGEWGTLIQVLVTRGLGDGKGVDYVPGTFHQVRVAGVNSREPFGITLAMDKLWSGLGCE